MLERQNYISWDEYFMGVALLAAKRSKDPNRQVGACIVKDNKILATGYNGFPNGCDDSKFYWGKSEDYRRINRIDKRRKNYELKKEFYEKQVEIHDKRWFVVHAEVNAILNSDRDLKDSTIYVDLFPCNECAKAVIQAGIKEVVYMSDEDDTKTSYRAAFMMFDAMGMTIRKLEKTEFIENLMKLN